MMDTDVSLSAAAFESRWTMRTLKRVDAELCQAVDEQRQLYHEARLIGNEQQIKEHGEAMCRGWSAAVKRMEQEQEPDDSYILGQSGGITVAIGVQQSASARVRELHGDRTIWLTPDEVASMFVGLQDIAKVKALWPGAEIVRVERYPDDPAQED
jgi:hypothetical protein